MSPFESYIDNFAEGNIVGLFGAYLRSNSTAHIFTPATTI